MTSCTKLKARPYFKAGFLVFGRNYQKREDLVRFGVYNMALDSLDFNRKDKYSF